jgi:hypothetical protein
MRKIIIFLVILLATILFTSCTTQQRVVYRDCDCNNSNYRFGWDTYWGWNSYRFWGWNDPLWGWNNQFWGWNRWNWHYNRPIIVYPKDPTRYERRQSVGERPSRVSSDNVYPRNTPSIPRIESRPSQQNSQPNRVQQRTYTPSRIETPSRVQQRTTTPSNNQPTRSRIQNN